MKIAIASDSNKVSGHFGHCQGFSIYEVENNSVVSNNFVQNPGHRPGFLPVFLRDNGVDVIISGGMGASAQHLFNESGIDVVVGAKGNCEDVINQFLKDNLESTGSICTQHMHEGHCGN